ncbi:SAVMC3_10250 family protein [Streptomyces fildesensis]|uniref:SAVMC3_10250 family protein n=1 Tax=Streptomyces fildesensis TaxID=375757 RepID=A0ABW8C270_9ACTN
MLMTRMREPATNHARSASVCTVCRPLGGTVTDLMYLSEQKLYGRLGIPRINSQREVSGSLKFPPVAPIVEISTSRSWSEERRESATLDDLAKGVKEIERNHDPVAFTDSNLRPNRWIRFDLDMAHAAVHEDSGQPPEDVALFVGGVPAGSGGQPRDTGVLLCGSVQHLRTRMIPAGRMGSDTTWLHDLVLALERREQEGLHVIPEFLTDVVPSRRPDHLREAAAMGVFGWTAREYPASCRSRMRGHAIVLMDVDGPHWVHRLVVASPLYVEVPLSSPGARRRLRFPWRRRALP